MNEQLRTKSEILEHNRAAALALDGALERLTDEQSTAPDAVGEWSLKDTRAHLSSNWLAGQVEALLASREPTAVECFGDDVPPGPQVDMSTNDGRNAWRHSIERELTAAEVRERFRQFVPCSRAAIERVPDSQFNVTYAIGAFGYVGRIGPARAGEDGVPLWRWIAGSQWHQIELHLPAFEAAGQQRASHSTSAR